jgi:NADH dehydrogenase FAD-containing subunit
MARVVEIDPAGKTIQYLGEGPGTFRYDELVLACGTQASLEVVKGMPSYGLPLKTLGDALFVRNQLIARLEQPELQPNIEHRRWRAVRVTDRAVQLESGELVSAGTVICTIGTEPNALIEALPVPKQRGRLAVNPDMSVPGLDGIWAVGDCAAVVNELDGKICPPTAQFAEAEATQLAANIVARVNGRPTEAFASSRAVSSLPSATTRRWPIFLGSDSTALCRGSCGAGCICCGAHGASVIARSPISEERGRYEWLAKHSLRPITG